MVIPNSSPGFGSIPRVSEPFNKIPGAAMREILSFETGPLGGPIPEALQRTGRRPEGGRSWMSRLHHGHQRHFIPSGGELLRCLQRQQTAETKTSQEIGSVRLEAPDFLQV